MNVYYKKKMKLEFLQNIMFKIKNIHKPFIIIITHYVLSYFNLVDNTLNHKHTITFLFLTRMNRVDKFEIFSVFHNTISWHWKQWSTINIHTKCTSYVFFFNFYREILFSEMMWCNCKSITVWVSEYKKQATAGISYTVTVPKSC
jgi:hypothetical protein